MESVRNALAIELFELGGKTITLGALATAAGLAVATLFAARLARRAVERFFAQRDVVDKGTPAVVGRLLQYAVLVLGLALALQTLGVNLATLFAAGALFAVAIGFAMQNVTANFVSGIILLVERVIKPGDVVQVDGEMVKVRDMGIRATIVRTLDDEDVVIPNSVLVQGSVKNYTFRDPLYRLRCAVGVAYSSDLAQVRATLETAAAALEWRSSTRDPVVLLSDFGASSVDFEVSIWTEDPWQSRYGRSALREAIWWALKDASITIAFPQLDVHLDPPQTASTPEEAS